MRIHQQTETRTQARHLSSEEVAEWLEDALRTEADNLLDGAAGGEVRHRPHGLLLGLNKLITSATKCVTFADPESGHIIKKELISDSKLRLYRKCGPDIY
jgi:hypothetical protein